MTSVGRTATIRLGLGGGGAQLLSVGKEAVNRVIALPDFGATLGGRKPRKRLRVEVVILSEPATGGAARPLATEAHAREALESAQTIFEREAGTVLFFDDWPRIRTIAEPAPHAALHVGCGASSWTQDLGEAGAYFRRMRSASGGVAGIGGRGEPITVFVVRDVAGKNGCSLGPLSAYVTVDRVRGPLIAHELGHSCGLWHSRSSGNLMLPAADSGTMTRLQQAVFRTSRHVTLA
jgi:hypothetical protein